MTPGVFTISNGGLLVPLGLPTVVIKALLATHDRAALFSIDKAVDQYEALLFPRLQKKFQESLVQT